MNSRSISSRFHAARCRSIMRPSRWQVPPVVICVTGKPYCASRRASLSVWMSPVSTHTRVAGSRLASVRSSSAVLPEPGLLIRFRQSTPCSRNRSRSDSAIIWFSFSTFDLSGKRSIGLYLQVIEIQFVPADQRGVIAATRRAARVVFHHSKFVPACVTDAALRTDAGIQLQAFPFRALQHRLKTKAERVHIDRGQLADAQSHSRWPRAGAARQLLAHGFKNRFCDGKLMHDTSL